MRFRFKIADIKPLIDHATAAPDHWHPMGYEKSKGPGLILVKDDGVYLMSNGTPGEMADGSVAEKGKEGTRKVVYAEKHGKGTWVSGDDYAEWFSTKDFADLDGVEAVIFDVTSNSIKILMVTRSKFTMEDARKQVQTWLADVSKLVYLPSPRHKKFFATGAGNRPTLLRQHPKAVILNDMSFEAAVQKFAAVRGNYA